MQQAMDRFGAIEALGEYLRAQSDEIVVQGDVPQARPADECESRGHQQRHEPEDRREGRHQDRPEPQPGRVEGGVESSLPLLLELVGEVRELLLQLGVLLGPPLFVLGQQHVVLGVVDDGILLARHGMAALCYDPIGQGERYQMLDFENGCMGFVFALEEDSLQAVMLDSGANTQAGDAVHRTGKLASVPVGEGLLGRIVDPLGRPLDGEEPVDAAEFWPAERAAPRIIDRDFVSEPVQSGLVVVDALFAVGRGQRELIIGDRSTGKSAVIIDTSSAVRSTFDASSAPDWMLPNDAVPASPSKASPDWKDSAQAVSPICCKPCGFTKLARASFPSEVDWPFVKRANTIPSASTLTPRSSAICRAKASRTSGCPAEGP